MVKPTNSSPLTVAQARQTDQEVVAVRGTIVITEHGATICDALSRSLPPQCVNGVKVTGYEFIDKQSLSNGRGGSTYWGPVDVMGRMENGVMTIRDRQIR